jgi:hypothetical protein
VAGICAFVPGKDDEEHDDDDDEERTATAAEEQQQQPTPWLLVFGRRGRRHGRGRCDDDRWGRWGRSRSLCIDGQLALLFELLGEVRVLLEKLLTGLVPHRVDEVDGQTG